MKKKLLIAQCFLFCVITFHLQAQTEKSKPVFKETTYNFGDIKEEGGKVSHQFVFTNLGKKPVIIENVTATCGCTTPSWSKAPVKPGEQGEITVVYNPRNRPGSFNKTIRVFMNASQAPQALRISGNVLPKPPTIADQYPHKIDNIRLKVRSFTFGKIYSDTVATKYIQVFNEGKVPVKIVPARVLPKHLKFKAMPQTLKPKEQGIISLTYDAAAKNDWGYVYDRIYLIFGNKDGNSQPIGVSAHIAERLSPDFLKNPPRFTLLGSKTYDFGKLKAGEKVTHVFEYQNTGRNDLIIRKASASCGCTATSQDKKILKPGEKGFIKAVFNTAGRLGKQHKTITVITNEPDEKGKPKRSETILVIKGELVK